MGKKRKNGRKNNVQGLFSKISLEAIEAENLGMLAIPGDKIAIKLWNLVSVHNLIPIYINLHL